MKCLKHTAAALAALLIFSLCVPAFSLGGASPRFGTPDEYNDNDYQKLAEFLENEDADGVKNGEKLSPDYDPGDPATWTDGGDARVEWILRGTKYRLGKVLCDGCAMVGELDLSGCEELDELLLGESRLSSIDLTGTKLRFETLRAEGAGAVAHTHGYDSVSDAIEYCSFAIAVPDEGAVFIGWFDDEGEYITSDLRLSVLWSPTVNLTARFTEEGEEYDCSGFDCLKLSAFLELEDENGVKNGEKLSPDYDPSRPETWARVEWRYSEGELYLRTVSFGGRALVGELDLSGCPMLERISCEINSGITGIKAADCPMLKGLSCSNCTVMELDLSGCASLDYLSCSRNALTELCVSDCPLLNDIDCVQNPIRLLDFSGNPRIPFGRISAEGRGSVGISCIVAPDRCYTAYAFNEPGFAFLGWYDDSFELISHYPEICADDGSAAHPNIIARFEGGEPVLAGDADGNGTVDVIDALLVLRYSMSVIQLGEESLELCDVNGNGVVDMTDALIILRCAMGIIGGFR